jgi:hypothetical protein
MKKAGKTASKSKKQQPKIRSACLFVPGWNCVLLSFRNLPSSHGIVAFWGLVFHLFTIYNAYVYVPLRKYYPVTESPRPDHARTDRTAPATASDATEAGKMGGAGILLRERWEKQEKP